MFNFDEIFNPLPEKQKEFIRNIHECLTRDKSCCACANSEKRDSSEMGYAITVCYCKLSGEYRDGRNGIDCKNWKAKYPEFERNVNE